MKINKDFVMGMVIGKATTWLIIILMMLLSGKSFGQDKMWSSEADLSKNDTLIFLRGTSSRLHDTLNGYRVSKDLEILTWDSLDGDYDRGLMWDFRCEEILFSYLEERTVHHIYDDDNDYCECEGVYYTSILKDRHVKKILNTKGSGYMFTSFAVYEGDYFFFISSEINGKTRNRLIKFE
jgi:hypothetical protein